MNDVFRQQHTEDQAVRTAFYNARDKMSKVLEAAIERQEEREKYLAVEHERESHWVTPQRIDREMKYLYKVHYLRLYVYV